MKATNIEQHVKKVAEFLDIGIYTPMEAFEHGVNTGMDWQSDIVQELTNERDELQKQVITLENEVNYLDSKIEEYKIYKSNIK